MKKIVLILMMVAFAMPAFASETRIRSLGPMVAPYIEDDSNVFMWYATLPSYSNLVTITAGYDDVYLGYDEEADYYDWIYSKFGLTWAFGEEGQYGTLGLWWEEHTRGPNNLPWFGGAWWGPEDNFDNTVYNKLNAMYGFTTEGGVAFGIYFNNASEHDLGEGGSQKDEYYISYNTLGLGIRWDLNESTYADFAFDLNWVGYNETDWESTEEWEADSKMTYDIRGRFFIEQSDVVTWVPYLHYKWGNLSVKSNETELPDDQCWGVKGHMLDLGLGTNLHVNDDNMIIVALNLYSNYKGEPSACGSDAEKEEISMQVLPGFVFGLESDVKDWLTFRAGCDKTLIKFTYKEASDPAYEEIYTFAPFNWYLGLGFHVGDFDIDAMLNKHVPFSMGYWLTGFQPDSYEDGLGPPITMISATYHF